LRIPCVRRIWGWFFSTWASQPYNTLLITFIFAPYGQRVVIWRRTAAQSAWGFESGRGFIKRDAAPILGALADLSGKQAAAGSLAVFDPVC